MIWTAEQLERARRLRVTRHSFKAIATALGVSAHAVKAKFRREGGAPRKHGKGQFREVGAGTRQKKPDAALRRFSWQEA